MTSYQYDCDENNKHAEERATDTAKDLAAQGPLGKANLLLDFLPHPETYPAR